MKRLKKQIEKAKTLTNQELLRRPGKAARRVLEERGFRFGARACGDCETCKINTLERGGPTLMGCENPVAFYVHNSGKALISGAK